MSSFLNTSVLAFLSQLKSLDPVTFPNVKLKSVAPSDAKLAPHNTTDPLNPTSEVKEVVPDRPSLLVIVVADATQVNPNR